MAMTTTQVSQLYVTLFGRASEKEGNQYWATHYDNQFEAAKVMLTLDIVKDYFGDAWNDNKAFIESIYQNTLGKDPAQDQEGVNYWLNELNQLLKQGKSLEEARAKVVVDLINAISQYENSDDPAAKAAALRFKNKVAVSNYTAEKVDKVPGKTKEEVLNNLKYFKDVIANVTDDPATVETAKQKVDSDLVVKNVSLTTGVDNIRGSVFDDTFKADLLTLNDGDNIDGRDGNDTLTATISNNITDAITIKNVENLIFTSLGAHSIDMKNMTGIKSFTSKDSTGTLTLNNIGQVMDINLEGSTSKVVANFTASALQGTSDLLNVTLKNASAADLQVNAGFEKLKVNVDGDSTLAGLTVPGVTTFISQGTGDLTVKNNVLDNFTTLIFNNDGKITLGSVSGVDLLSAQDNTKGVVAAKVDTKGFADPAQNKITLNSSGSGTVLLGSGDDNLAIDGSGSGTDTIDTGAGNDKLVFKVGKANFVLRMQDGDDVVKFDTSNNGISTSDTIDLGAGNDKVIVDDDQNQSMILKGVENLDIVVSKGGNTINLDGTTDKVAVTIKENDDNKALILKNLPTGSTVEVVNATDEMQKAGSLTIGYKDTEDETTINVRTEVNEGANFTLNKVNRVTVNFDEAVGSAAGGAAGYFDFADSTDVTINAAKLFNGGNIQSTNDKTEAVKLTGQDAVTVGDLTSKALKTVELTAEKDLKVGKVTASNNLSTVKYVSNAGGINCGDIGSGTVTNLSSVEIAAAKDITASMIDAKEIGNIKISSTSGKITVGDINTPTGKIGDIDIEAKSDVTLNKVGNGDDTLSSLKVISHDGAIKLNQPVDVKDSDGFDVTLSAATTIDNGSGSAQTIKNEDGNINTVTLSGNASAKVDFTVGGSGHYVQTVDASGLKGGLTTVITNADDLDSVSSSTTVSLGAKDSSTQNSVTFQGSVDSITVNGSAGQDTIILGTSTAAAKIASGTISLGGGTDKLDLTYLAGIKAADDGAVINLSSSSQTVDGTSVAAGKIVEFDGNDDGTNNAAGGYSFTVSGVDEIVGTDSNDVIFAANTGTTITGGKGDDKIVLNAGTDKVIFSTASDNGTDTIEGLKEGTDILDLTNVITNLGYLDADTGAAGIQAYASNSTNDVKAKDKIAIVKGTITNLDEANEIAGLFKSSDGTNVVDSVLDLGTDVGNACIVLTVDPNSTTAHLWYVEERDGTQGIDPNNDTIIHLAEIHLTANYVDGGFNAADFGI